MESIHIRAALQEDIKTISEIHVGTWRTTYSGILPSHFLNTIRVEDRADHWFKVLEYNQKNIQNALFVASIDGNLCGFASCGPKRNGGAEKSAELYALYILENYQKQKVGYKLFAQVSNFLKNNNFDSVMAWSLSQNFGAHKAYERWGAKKQPEKTKKLTIEGSDFEEISHIWLL